MPAWRTLWDIAGRVDDVRGRLEVLFWAAVASGGLSVASWAVFMDALGSAGAVALIVGAALALVGVMGLLATRSGSPRKRMSRAAPASAAKRQAAIDQLEKPNTGTPGEDRTEALRTSALLLRTELLDIQNKIARFDKDRVIPDGFAFPAAEWARYRELIAREPGLYDVLIKAYTAAHRVNESFVWRRTVSTSRLIGVSDEDGLPDAAAATVKAVEALDAFLAARPTRSAIQIELDQRRVATTSERLDADREERKLQIAGYELLSEFAEGPVHGGIRFARLPTRAEAWSLRVQGWLVAHRPAAAREVPTKADTWDELIRGYLDLLKRP